MSFALRPSERRRDAGQQSHRAQVDPLSEALAQRQDQLTRGDVVGHPRIADGAEIDRVELHQAIDAVVVHHATVLEVVVASPRNLRELATEAALLGGQVQDFDAGGHDFLADAVASDNCNSIVLHAD